jgi:hypothetical protein
MTASLNELANRYGTDKGDGCWDKHDYASTYEALLRARPSFPNGRIALLEIGVWDPRNPGASARMWRAFLGPDAVLYGIDVAPACLALREECGMTVELVNQSDAEGLARARERMPRFDLVVDDGSHIADHQRIALEALWPTVLAGGYYAVEDLHAPQSTSKAELDAVALRLGGEPLPALPPKIWIARSPPRRRRV